MNSVLSGFGDFTAFGVQNIGLMLSVIQDARQVFGIQCAVEPDIKLLNRSGVDPLHHCIRQGAKMAGEQAFQTLGSLTRQYRPFVDQAVFLVAKAKRTE